MKLVNPKITINIKPDQTEITIHDSGSATSFCVVTLTPEQLSEALSGLYRTECQVELKDLDRVGKTMEIKTFEFEGHGVARGIALNQLCFRGLEESGMSDWIPDNSYSSLDSFFIKDDKEWARTTIRRWV